MLCLIDSYQNKVSADQYYLTVSRAQVSTHQVRVFFWSYLLTIYSFSNDRRFRFFKIHIKYVVFMSLSPSTITMLISIWPQTQKFSQSFQTTCGEDLFLPWSPVGHSPRSIFMLWLVKIWQVRSCVKFMQHILKFDCFDSWSWQSFESTCDVFDCRFPLDVQNEIQLLLLMAGLFIGFLLRNASLVKADNPISDGIVFVLHLAWCVRESWRLKRSLPY